MKIAILIYLLIILLSALCWAMFARRVLDKFEGRLSEEGYRPLEKRLRIEFLIPFAIVGLFIGAIPCLGIFVSFSVVFLPEEKVYEIMCQRYEEMKKIL